MYVSFGKRLFDMLFAAISLIVFSPLMMLIAIMIILFDPGPVIFKQRRIGKDGREFWLYKFRSMPVNIRDIASDELGSLKLSWIGRLVRRTNIDELPQLLNILIGDMSIVGPRPPIPAQTELITARRKNGALKCRPGLTGLAQINSFDFMPPEQKADYDGQYARGISFKKDLGIILRTFGYLLKPPPVY